MRQWNDTSKRETMGSPLGRGDESLPRAKGQGQKVDGNCMVIRKCNELFRKIIADVAKAMSVCTDLGMFLDIPIWHVYGKEPLFGLGMVTAIYDNWGESKKQAMGSEYRGIAFSSQELLRILVRGIDVEPTDACFYASDLSKALEYGGDPKLVLMLEPRMCRSTWLQFFSDSESSEIESAKETYPYELRQDDGGIILSRMEDERHRFSSYEFEYARWIPGNAREALKGVMIFDNGLSSDCSEEEWMKRFRLLLSGQVESDKMPFVRISREQRKNRKEIK